MRTWRVIVMAVVSGFEVIFAEALACLAWALSS